MYEGVKLEEVDEFKYLGVIMDKDCSTEGQAKVCKKRLKAS